MDKLVITEFVSLIVAHDVQGQRREFTNRQSACFIVTAKGRIRFAYGGGEVVAEPGRAVFLPAGLDYINECLEEAVSTVFNFQTLQRYDAPQVLGTVGEALLEEYRLRISACTYAPSEQSRLLIMETLYALAGRLFSGCDRADAVHPIAAKAFFDSSN